MSEATWWLDEPGLPSDGADCVLSADEAAAWAASAPVGVGVLTPFGPINPDELSDTGRIDALRALERLRAWTDAQQARVFAAMSVGPGDVVAGVSDAGQRDKQWIREEIGCALRLSPMAVNARLHDSRELVNRLPGTLALLDEGVISVRHVSALVEAVGRLDDETAAEVEARVLARAGVQTPAALRRSVRRAVAALDPADAEQRHAARVSDRRMCVKPVDDGMAELWALLPADGAAELVAAVNAVAAGPVAAGDERTADQRRVDALVALAALRLDDPSVPNWHGRRPSVQVTVAAATLLGLDDLPGELDGYGPIPASIARRIAADPTGTWRRLLCDPPGHVIDAAATYRPPAQLTEFVVARDRSCRFPGCARGARRCEIDHQTPWQDGGPSSAANLEALCPRHHHLKHEAGWTVTGDPAGELTWTSPTGRTYRAPPELYE